MSPRLGGHGKMKAKQEMDTLSGRGASFMAERAAYKRRPRRPSPRSLMGRGFRRRERRDEKEVKADQLPEELKKMDKPALDKYIDETGRRKQIKTK